MLSRIISCMLTLAMVFTLMPSGMTVKAADMNVTLHVYNDGMWGGLGYDAIYLQWWDGNATVTNATEEEFAAWNITRYKLTDEGDNWYTLTMQGNVDGF